MTSPTTLKTSRLDLRLWRDEDLPALAAMNADPRVMEFFPKVLDRAESDAMAARVRDHFARRGFGFWVVEVPGIADFIGFVGLAVPTFETHFTPCVEIGWRLIPEHWGKGYATEAALASLDFGFRQLGLDEIVSFTALSNVRSSASWSASACRTRPPMISIIRPSPKGTPSDAMSYTEPEALSNSPPIANRNRFS